MSRRFQFSLASVFWVVFIVGLIFSNSSGVKLVICNGVLSAFAIQRVVAMCRYHRLPGENQPPTKVLAAWMITAFWVALAAIMWGATFYHWHRDPITLRTDFRQPI